jgi:hypothetical protein
MKYNEFTPAILNMELANVRKYTALDLPNDPFFEPGPSPAVSDSFWVILEPLPPSKHDIHFKASLTNPTTGILFYSDDLKYTVNAANITSPN